MKNIIEVRGNAIYTGTDNELKPQVELIIIHTDGKQYNVKGKEVVTVPILRETRFTADPEELDRLIADLQKFKLMMTTIQQNCKVINSVVEQLNKPS